MKNLFFAIVAILFAGTLFAQQELTVEQRLDALEKKMKVVQTSVKEVKTTLKTTRQTVKVVKVGLDNLTSSTDSNFTAVNENFESTKQTVGTVYRRTTDSLSAFKKATNANLTALDNDKAGNGKVQVILYLALFSLLLSLFILIFIKVEPADPEEKSFGQKAKALWKRIWTKKNKLRVIHEGNTEI